MLNNIFLYVLLLSIKAIPLIIIVLFIRILIKNLPKRISYLSWTIILFRLISNYKFNSIKSITIINENRLINNIISLSENITNASVINNLSKDIYINLNSNNSFTNVISFLAIIWLAGFIFIISKNIKSYLNLKKFVKKSSLVSDNIYSSQDLDYPLVFGILKPKIIIPSTLNNNERDYIIYHEQVHIERKDYITSLFAFIVLSIHWFNPFVWLAYYESSKDMEMACDEKVIKTFGNQIKKEYSNSILNLSTNTNILSVSFSSGNTKNRIKHVLNFKQSKTWIVIISSLSIIIGSFLLLSDFNKPKSNNNIIDNDKNRPADLVEDFYKYPEDYTLDQAISDGMFVEVHGSVYKNSHLILENFITKVNNKRDAYVDIVRVTIEGAPILHRIIYENNTFLIIIDYSRDYYRTHTNEPFIHSFKYIKDFYIDNEVLIYGTDIEDLSLEDILSNNYEFDSTFMIVEYNK